MNPAKMAPMERQRWLKHRETCFVAYQNLRNAKIEEEKAIRKARAAGISYTDIASWIGVTEAAVRMRFNRRKWSK